MLTVNETITACEIVENALLPHAYDLRKFRILVLPRNNQTELDREDDDDFFEDGDNLYIHAPIDLEQEL